jgi:hypothetical protein
MPTWENEQNHGDNGTLPTQSTTTHQSSYLQYDDDDSTIESLPPPNQCTHADSSNSEEEGTVHRRNLSFDEFPGNASNETSNPFRNNTPHEDEQLPHFPDLLLTLKRLRQSSHLQAIPENFWDPTTRNQEQRQSC